MGELLQSISGWVAQSTGIGRESESESEIKITGDVPQPYLPNTEEKDFFKMEDPVHAFEDDALGDFSGRGAVDIGRGAKEVILKEERGLLERVSSALSAVLSDAKEENVVAPVGSLAQPSFNNIDTKNKNRKNLKPVGVGLHLSYDDTEEVLVVNNIEKGGSADLDGTLKAGDIVLELEGVDVTTGHPIDIIEAILLGRTGTLCNMLVRRVEPDGMTRDLTCSLKRKQHNQDEKAVAPSRCGPHYNPQPGKCERIIFVHFLLVIAKPCALVAEASRRPGVGITFEIDTFDSAARVKQLVHNGPAAKSRLIRPGDVLYEIDGTTVFREPLDVIAALLLGEPGTEVTRASSAIRLLPPLDAICVLGRQASIRDILQYAQAARALVSDLESGMAERRQRKDMLSPHRLSASAGGKHL